MKLERGSRKTRPARIVNGVACAGLAVVGALTLYGSAPAAGQGPAEASIESRTQAVALTVTAFELAPVELARIVAVSGAIHAWQEVIIAPEVGGYRVAEVHVDVGDTVTAGQPLVELSTELLAADLATRRAMVKQREAELVNAESSLARGESLAAMDLLADADLDRLRSEKLGSEARLESAQADLETARLRLRFARVTAPDDGVITSRTVTVGQVAQAGGEMLRLLRKDRVEWRGEVPEARLADLQPGQSVLVTTADGAQIRGRVRVVAPTVASANRTGLVYVDLDTRDNARPGMFARGEIETGFSAALMIPLESIVSADGYSYVFVLGPERIVARRRIETGAVRGDSIEVVAGLSTGEVIVEAGAGFLKDGDRVDVAR